MGWILGTKIYFISDAHLGAPNPRRPHREQEDAMVDFLRAIQADAEALYIAGDLFDFWFEYRSAVPSTCAKVVFELYHLVQAGVQVVYIPGNHDLWPGRYFSDEVGVALPGDPVEAIHQGKRLYITHGDSFRKDWKFNLSRGILKHPWCVALFQLLHPDIGIWLARMTSRYSEFRVRKKDVGAAKVQSKIYLDAARQKMDEGFDIVVCGHYHRMTIESVENGQLVILGDWMRYDAYAVLEDGEMTLHQWRTAPRIYKDQKRD